jgi:hypothetical protein
VLEDFVVARNPDGDSALPFLIRIPLPGRPVVLKARESWPRTTKVYCHRAEAWPGSVEVIEQVPTRACERRGAAIDLVLDRARENRSQLIFTRIRGGREAIFWQSARTTKQARPGVRTPTARAAGLDRFVIVVDSHERYPYRFSTQQVDVVRRALPAGDYAVELDGRVVAAVERKSLADLVASMTGGRLRYAMGELAALPRAAIVVEDRWSEVFKLTRVRPAVVADGLAEVQVRWPSVPIVFTETRPLAQEWTYRWLAAALEAAAEDVQGADRLAGLIVATELAPGRWQPPPKSKPVPAVHPPAAEMRAWARGAGLDVSDRGRLPPQVIAAYRAEHRGAGATSSP